MIQDMHCLCQNGAMITAHDYKNSYVKQQYLPDNIKNAKIYHPKDNKNERMLRDIMDKLENL